MDKKYEIIDRIIEAGIYLYFIFVFLTKGEGIRNILLFSSFSLWLLTLKYRQDKWIFKEPVSILFFGFIGTILISVVFSIDPLYSFFSLREHPLKSVLLFLLFSTVLSDEDRLKRFVYISYFVLVLTIFVGYYSYWVYDLPVMKPATSIRHAWHSRFAVDLNTLIPFTFILLLITKDIRLKFMFLITIIAAIFALILSTSRGGAVAFLSMTIVWAIYISRKYRISLRLLIAGSILVMFLSGVVSYYSFPGIRERILRTSEDITTLTERTEIWAPLISAALDRPLFGWGYGSEIFKIDKPFENTPYKVAPVNHDPAYRNPHNPFLRVFFHQGIVGLIFYTLLLITATGAIWRDAFNADGFKSYILIACAGILIGTYFVNAIVENSHLTDLTVILGIGLAARNLNK